MGNKTFLSDLVTYDPSIMLKAVAMFSDYDNHDPS